MLKVFLSKIKALFIKTEELNLWLLEGPFFMALKILRLGRGDFLLHYINFRLCQALFLLNKFFDSKRKVASKKKYFNFHDKSLENSFSSACDWMKANKKKPCADIVNFSNYSFTTAKSLKNQLQYDNIPKPLIKNIEDSLEASGLLIECSRIFNCHYKVVQMRSWLWLPKKMQTGLPIEAHYDFINAGTLKIMFYQGYFEKNNSAIDLYLDVSTIEKHKRGENVTGLKRTKITGKDLVLVFDSNSILHSAQLPKEIRPTIELTIMPSMKDSYKIIQAGSRANLPYNPFKKCSKLINICRSY